MRRKRQIHPGDATDSGESGWSSEEQINLNALDSHGRAPALGAFLFVLCVCFTLMSANGATVIVEKDVTLEIDAWWQEIRSPYQNTHELIGGRRPDGTMQARASIMVLRHSSPEKALARLQQEAKLTGDTTSLRIAGRPALRVSEKVETERQLNDDQPPIRSNTQRVTTFIAIDRLVVVITATLARGASPDASDRLEKLALGLHAPRPLSAKELDEAIVGVNRAISTKPKVTARMILPLEEPKIAYTPATRRTEVTTAAVLAGRSGELEVAVSPDGTDVVIATNGGIFHSNDGGATWSTRQSYPAPGVLSTRGDPSVARAPSGRFYVSYLSRERRGTAACDTSAADCRDSVSIALSEPADRGANFAFTSNVAVCDPSEDPFLTDQPHMVVAATPIGIDHEAIYVVWRRRVPDDATTASTCSNLGESHFTSELTCSGDGGKTWTHSIKIDNWGSYPRLGMGADGKVYVIAVRRSGGGTINLTRVSSCADGLEIEEGFPVPVGPFEGVGCPVPGLDRCNSGNTLSSPTVTGDPSRESTVFVAFATRNGEGNEDIVVRASTDSGSTFAEPVLANPPGIVARRFMPWSCAVPGGVYVGWYDRELATPAANDLTSYHAAFLSFKPNNNPPEPLRRFAPVDVSAGAPDPQCSLWFTAPRSIGDSENCSVQPQLAGFTPNAAGECTGGGTPCDFSDSATSAPALNCCIGRGAPKYGDYNGIARAGQRAFVAWASGTAPPGATPPSAGSIGTYFAILGHVETPATVVIPGDFEVGRGHVDFTCPDELCRVVVPVPKLCQLAIDCLGCGNNQLCLGDAVLVEGLPVEASIKLIDESGRTIAEAKREGNLHRLPTGSVKFDPTAGGKGLSLEIRPNKKFPLGMKHSIKITLEKK